MNASPDRPKNRRKTLRIVAALAAGGALAATTFELDTAKASSASVPQRASIVIRPSAHGREVVLSPNIAIRPGIPVTVAVLNASREAHTFTIPELGVNSIVLPGSPHKPRVAEITFTAHEFGVFKWHCELCPQVHHQGPMSGEVYAIIGS